MISRAEVVRVFLAAMPAANDRFATGVDAHARHLIDVFNRPMTYAVRVALLDCMWFFIGNAHDAGADHTATKHAWNTIIEYRKQCWRFQRARNTKARRGDFVVANTVYDNPTAAKRKAREVGERTVTRIAPNGATETIRVGRAA